MRLDVPDSHLADTGAAGSKGDVAEMKGIEDAGIIDRDGRSRSHD